MSDEGITIEGLAALQQQLTDLGTKKAEKAVRKALRAGAEIERSALSEYAPVNATGGGSIPPGALKNDIVIQMKRDTDGSIYANVTPDKYTAWVGRLVEYGHREVTGGRSKKLANGKTRGPGKQIGEVPEHPWVRPAFEATQSEVASAITSTLLSEIEKEAAKKG